MKSAVQWLEEAINNKLKSQLGPSFIDLFDEAKAIEKHQIIEAYREGRTDQQSGIDKFYNRSSASYYNSTYGQ